MATTPRHARIIHSAWFQGLDAAPAMVRYNLDRWASLNPGYALNILDQKAADDLLGDCGIALDGVEPQALSDMVRIKLLLEQGGVWADATLLPVAPLDDWLGDKTRPSGFFALSRPWSGVIVASWFLAAEAGHPIVRRWWDETLRYWERPRTLRPGLPENPAASVDPGSADWVDAYPYHWVQYLLEHRVGADGSVARALSAEAHMDGVPGQRFREGLVAGETELEPLMRLARSCPVQKLNWRMDLPVDLIARVMSAMD